MIDTDELVEGLVEDAEENHRTALLGMSTVACSPLSTRQQLDNAHDRYLTRIAYAFAFDPTTGTYQ